MVSTRSQLIRRPRCARFVLNDVRMDKKTSFLRPCWYSARGRLTLSKEALANALQDVVEKCNDERQELSPPMTLEDLYLRPTQLRKGSLKRNRGCQCMLLRYPKVRTGMLSPSKRKDSTHWNLTMLSKEKRGGEWVGRWLV